MALRMTTILCLPEFRFYRETKDLVVILTLRDSFPDFIGIRMTVLPSRQGRDLGSRRYPKKGDSSPDTIGVKIGYFT